MSDALGWQTAQRLLRKHFVNREDVMAILAPWGKPCPVTFDEIEPLLAAHVRGESAPSVNVEYRHASGTCRLEGRFRIGSYCPGIDGATRWLCVDFDGAGHANALVDPEKAARAARSSAKTLGLPSYLEKSGGGHGWHLWCFFDPPIAAADARTLGHRLAPTDAPLVRGGIAEPNAGRGIEVFPKQDVVRSGGLGNLVWLPWWSNAESDGCQFFRPDEQGELVVSCPTELETVEPGVASQLIAPKSASSPDTARQTSLDWKSWRERALASLPLESIYGEWLTGKRAGAGWLECRDPSSPSGDRSPSAGVADGTGEAERGTYHSFISSTSMSVFDFLIERGQAADFREACDRVAELSSVDVPARSQTSTPSEGELRPEVKYVAWEGHVAVRAGVRALGRDSSIYQRAQRLVRVVPEDEFRDPLETAGAQPLVSTLSAPTVWEILSAQVAWLKYDGRAQSFVPCEPPDRVVQAVHKRGAWPEVRVLSGITSAPILRANGSLHETPGYDAETGLLFRPTSEIDPIPECPTRDDARRAGAELCDVVCDFPFAAPVHRSAWLAALLSPLAWPAYQQGTPLFLFDAHTPGTGKTLLCDAVGVIASGRSMVRSPYVVDDDEIRKRITAHALSGDALVLIDNVPTGGRVGWPSLDSALTGERWKDRVLSKSENADLRLNIVWYVTGNNLSVHGDLARRSLVIRLASNRERPEEREGFRHHPLLPWLHTQRPRLVAQALTLLHAYLIADRPSQKLSSLGSFEAWSDVVRQAIVWAGLPDPVETCLSKDPDADDQRGIHIQALLGWRRLLGGGTGLTASQAVELLDNDRAGDHRALRAALAELCPSKTGLPSTRSLGRKIRSLKGRWRTVEIDGVAKRLSFSQASEKARGGILRWTVLEEADV